MESQIMQTSFFSFSSLDTANSVNRDRFSSIAKLSSIAFPQMTRTTCVSSMSKKDGGTSGLTYKDSGVDIDAGTELIRRAAKMAPEIGGFSGRIPLGDSYLVLGMDGVGTKLKLAFEIGIHETVGIDLVAIIKNMLSTLFLRLLCS